jgi:hypothetical protein
MARTPETIQQRFHLPAECGTRSIPRVHHAFRGERQSDRRRYLATVYPAMVKGSLHGEGTPNKWQRTVTQQELAESSGCARQTYTDRLSRFTELSPQFNTVESRKEHALRLHARAQNRYNVHAEQCESCRDGNPCEIGARLKARIRRPRERRELPRPLPVLTRSRRFAAANRMGFNLPKREEIYVVIETLSGRQVATRYSQETAAAECECLERESGRPHQVELLPVDKREYRTASLDQLLDEANPGRQWWEAELDCGYKQEPWPDGFKQIQCWYWDPRILDPDDGRSLGTTERLVMSAYEEFGLLEEFRDNGKLTKPRGMLYIHQAKVAAYCGISIRKLYDANKKWEKLGILRIAHDRREPGCEDNPSDQWTSSPQIVLYVPFRQLTEAEAARETARMETELRGIIAREGQQRAAQVERIRTIHQELLRAWTGTERWLATLWRAVEKELITAGIDAGLIRIVIPIPLRNQRE